MPKSPTTDEQIAGMTFTVVQRNGRWCHLWSDGTLLPVVSGGSDAPPADPPPPAPPADPPPPPAPELKFTPEQQAEIDKIVQGRVAATKTATQREAVEQLAKDLGVSIDEAKTIVADHKQRKNDEADEKTKREAAEVGKVEAETREKATRRDASIRIAVADATAGLAEAEKDDAKRAKIRSDIAVLVTNELGADKLEPTDDEVAAALKAVRDLHAAMFDAGKKGTPGDPGKPPGGGGGKSDFERGKEMGEAARQRAAARDDLGDLTDISGRKIAV